MVGGVSDVKHLRIRKLGRWQVVDPLIEVVQVLHVLRLVQRASLVLLHSTLVLEVDLLVLRGHIGFVTYTLQVALINSLHVGLIWVLGGIDTDRSVQLTVLWIPVGYLVRCLAHHLLLIVRKKQHLVVVSALVGVG